MPRKEIRQLRQEARVRREVEEELRKEDEELQYQKELRYAAKLLEIQNKPVTMMEEEVPPEKMEPTEKKSDLLKWKSTEVVIQAGAAQEFSIDTAPGDRLEYTFHTEGGDIAFGILMETCDGGTDVVVEKERVQSDENPVQGVVVSTHKGKLWLQWDNTYSWLTSKQLIYSMTLHPLKTNNGDSLNNGVDKWTSKVVNVIFVLGGPGSGKGTQCTKMESDLDLVHLSAGDLLREERNNPNSKDGALIEAYIKEGKIVPIEITVKLLIAAMRCSESTTFLIDGFPRNQDNLDGWLRETSALENIKVQGVWFFDCPQNVMEKRLVERGKTSGRSDDNLESIRKRFETFHNESMPIIDYFNKKGQVWTIPTDRSPEVIEAELRILIGKLLPSMIPEPDHHPVVEPLADAPITVKKPIRVILGTMTMSDQVDKPTSESFLEAFVASNCARNHTTGSRVEIDTARMYNHGKSEECIGNILLNREDLADRILVATKANPFPGFNENLRPENVLTQAFESLQALHKTSLDIFYLHSPDHSTNIESTLKAVQQLYEQGKIRELGLSNYAAWQVVHIYHLCKSRGWVVPTVYQGMYNPITRDVERELIPALRNLNIRFYAYNPLAGGLLSGKHASYSKSANLGRFHNNEKYQDRFWKPEYFNALDQIKIACETHRIPMAEASIRWIMHHSLLDSAFNDGVILGASSMEQLNMNLKAADSPPLPYDVVDAFEQGWVSCKPVCPSYLR